MRKENSGKPDALEYVREYEAGEITRGELSNELSKFCWAYPPERRELIDHLLEHPLESIQNVTREIQEMIRQQEEQVKDIDQIRKTSPLQPGVVLSLNAGYDAAYSAPWWLNGRQNYHATFIDFVGRGIDKMPAAVVELDEEIDLTEGAGLRHRGRFA